jgi:hypothetical protein
MIKVYVDWGVMSQIKHGQHAELHQLLERKQQLYVIYSTSHISDILVSHNGEEEQNQRIKSDLDFISSLTDNWCAHNAEKEIMIRQRDPHELFVDRVDDRNEYREEGPLAYLSRLLEPDSAAYSALQDYMNAPINETIASGYGNPSVATGMDHHYPGLQENPSMGNLLKISWLKNKEMEETDAYKGMRETVQDGLGLNKDKMFAKDDPFATIDKLYSSIKELTGFDIYNILRNDNSPSWFQDISHNYLLLDMHGYQQDKIKVDARNKDTMRNTIDDGFHAAFASTCDFYITNDSRSANKAKQVYQKLKLNTRICSPEEFVTYGNQSLVYNDPKMHVRLWCSLLNSPDYNESVVDDATWRTYLLEFFLFDYFNKVFVVFAPESKQPMIILSKNKPTNYRYTTELDVKAIIQKLNTAFDGTGTECIDPAEVISLENLQFKWEVERTIFRLQMMNGYLQLYMDLHDQFTPATPETNNTQDNV